jgi:chemotaxis response regulator CheB
MRALCVGRHPYLSEHLCRFFEKLGVATMPCNGMADAARSVERFDPDVVICDYDLLATKPLTNWETDPALSAVPVIAVSLTRHPGEAHLLDVNGIAGFLYLPTLDPDDAQRFLSGVRRKRGEGSVTSPTTESLRPWPGTTPVAELR